MGSIKGWVCKRLVTHTMTTKGFVFLYVVGLNLSIRILLSINLATCHLHTCLCHCVYLNDNKPPQDTKLVRRFAPIRGQVQ